MIIVTVLGFILLATGFIIFTKAKNIDDAISRNFRRVGGLWAAVFGIVLMIPGTIFIEIGVAAVLALIIYGTYMVTKPREKSSSV